MSETKRCEVCDWPLAATMKEGCVPGNCSYRPHEGTAEYFRIKKRREELESRGIERPAALAQVSRDFATPPPETLLEVARDIVYFADQAGMADDNWRHRLGKLREIVAEPAIQKENAVNWKSVLVGPTVDATTTLYQQLTAIETDGWEIVAIHPNAPGEFMVFARRKRS